MPTALVTGANGFIGSHLVRALLARGYEVRCLVRSTSDLSSLAGLSAPTFVGDLTEPETLTAPVKGVDYIFHDAAALLVTSREEFDETNTVGTKNLLAAAEQYAKPQLKRFLFVSSQAGAGPCDDTTPKTEAMPMTPISWYGSSKKAAEEVVNAYAAKLSVTIIRPSSVYGERERDLSQTFPIIEAHIHPKLGILSKYVVMVYVGDLVDGIIRAAESSTTLGQAYFLNHPQALTSQEVIKTIAQAMGKPWGITIPMPLFLLTLAAPVAEFMHHLTRDRATMTRDKAREVSQRFWIADPSKAKRDFGWEAAHTLLDGMKKTIPYYRDEQATLRAMPKEQSFLLWLKFIFIGMIIGSGIEITSYLAKFYWFTPQWLAFVVALGGFGVALGTVAFWLRKKSDFIQFLVGTLIVGSVELINELGLKFWQFAEAWPFGITSPWVRVAVLALPGGFVVLIINYVMRELYKRRMRIG